jgi:FtsH-binding integral membrane protein
MTLKNYYNVNTREEGMNTLMRSVYMWMMIGLLVSEITAYDTQKIKQMGDEMETEGETNISKIDIIGASELYLDLINLILMLLEFFGVQKR